MGQDDETKDLIFLVQKEREKDEDNCVVRTYDVD